jgi:hypothetical protein
MRKREWSRSREQEIPVSLVVTDASCAWVNDRINEEFMVA